MNAEQLERIESLFHDALEREPAERSSFLAAIAPEFRANVESLLKADADALEFIVSDTPIIASPASP